MILVTAVMVLLARYTGNQDIIVGMPIYRQDTREAFVNTVVALRNRLEDRVTFKDLLLLVRQTVIDADQNQNYAIETLLYQLDIPDTSPGFPLFDTAVLLENVHDKSYIGHLPLNTVFCFERREDIIVGELEYNPGRYREETAQQIVTHLLGLLKRVLTDVTVEVETVEFLAPGEKQRLLLDFNNTAVEFSYEETIVELFSEQVRQTPDHIALIGQIPNSKPQIPNREGYLSYRKLNQESNRLAHLLRRKGVKPDQLVGIMTQRTAAAVIGIVGILKSGGAYLPIDPEAPAAGNDSIMNDAGVFIVLNATAERNTVTGTANREELQPEHLVDILTGIEDTDPPRVNRSIDLAYSIFTSGSTGKPKGVVVRHYNVHNLLSGLKERIYDQYGAVYMKVGLVSPFVFDASVKQVFAALLQGHGLCIAAEEVRVEVRGLFGFCRRHVIDIMDGTPAHLVMLTEAMGQSLTGPGVKHFLIGGETLTRQVVEEFFNRYPPAAPRPKITNIYGPTECTVDNAAYDISGQNTDLPGEIPIGKPMLNSRLYIVDSNKNPVPVGVTGELYITGASVGRGYLNQPELAAAKFDHDLWDYLDYHDEKKNYKLQNTNYKQITNYKLQITKKTAHQFRQLIRTGATPNQKFLQGGPRGTVFTKRVPPGRRRQKAYRTGDLAKWLPDGNVIFQGRKDQQVKIRGFRIEPEEIRKRLLRHESVKEAVVALKLDSEKDKYLCAYIVGDVSAGKETDISQLKEYLSGELPAYMIPTRFVLLEALPLTSNGKVDLKALPEPAVGSDTGCIAPRDVLEKKLAETWSQLLSIEKHQIGIDDNFFEIGGHSLKATILISRIHKAFQIKITLSEIFHGPCIRELAARIREKTTQRFYSIPPVEKKDYYPLTPAVKRLYFQQQLDLGSIAYNVYSVMVLEGNLEKKRLEDAFRKLTRRHESLRTSFHLLAGEPVQRVHDEVEFEIEYKEVEEKGQKTEDRQGTYLSSSDVIRHLSSEFIRPFDFSRAPLLDVGLVKTGEKEHLLITSLHHTAADGTSVGILVREFMAIYNSEELPELIIQYKDFSQWKEQQFQEGGQLWEKQEQYWLEQFKSGIPVLNLPCDYPRPERKSDEGEIMESVVGAKETQKLRELARRENVTLYILGLAVFNVLLMKLSGQDDIVVGTPNAGRLHADLEHLVGMFVNTLALRNHPLEHKIFTSFLKEVKENTLQAFANQDYGFETLVSRVLTKRAPSRNPLADVFFALQNMDRPFLEIPGLRLRPYEEGIYRARFDICFHIFEVGTQLNCLVEYCTRLFKKETIEMFIKNFKEIIAAVLENPGIQLQDIDISTEVIKTAGRMPQVDLGF